MSIEWTAVPENDGVIMSRSQVTSMRQQACDYPTVTSYYVSALCESHELLRSELADAKGIIRALVAKAGQPQGGRGSDSAG